MLKSETSAVSEQAECRAAEIRRLQATVETYKLSNDELNVSLTTASTRQSAQECLSLPRG